MEQNIEDLYEKISTVSYTVPFYAQAENIYPREPFDIHIFEGIATKKVPGDEKRFLDYEAAAIFDDELFLGNGSNIETAVGLVQHQVTKYFLKKVSRVLESERII